MFVVAAGGSGQRPAGNHRDGSDSSVRVDRWTAKNERDELVTYTGIFELNKCLRGAASSESTDSDRGFVMGTAGWPIMLLYRLDSSILTAAMLD